MYEIQNDHVLVLRAGITLLKGNHVLQLTIMFVLEKNTMFTIYV